jgi:hypothetical protein
MPHKIIVGTRETLEDYINGATLGNPIPTLDLPVGGKTLVFTTPAVTVTLSGAVGSFMSLAAVVTEINAAVGSTVAVSRAYDYGPHTTSRAGDGRLIPKQRLVFQRDAGLALDGTGTALADLGLSAFTSAGIIPIAKISGMTGGPSFGQLTLIVSP